MDMAESDDLIRRLGELTQLLRRTTDPVVATVLSDDIGDVESRIRAARSPDKLAGR
jgi:hypothetical protein